jgi:hypothetical protein
MNQHLIKIFFGSGCMAIASIFINATIGTPDTSKVIPYPEVMNLKTVPKFDGQGMIYRSVADKITQNPSSKSQKSDRQQQR